MNREAIYAAAFNLFSGLAQFNTKSRILQHWNDVPVDGQPALFQAQKREIPTIQTGLPTVWDLELDLYVYVRTDGSTPPSTLLNPILDAVEAALGHTPDNVQTLGGLVAYARLAGAIETDEGTLGNQAVAIIPVSIRV